MESSENNVCIRIYRFVVYLISGSIYTVGGHAIVKASSSWNEAVGFPLQKSAQQTNQNTNACFIASHSQELHFWWFCFCGYIILGSL